MKCVTFSEVWEAEACFWSLAEWAGIDEALWEHLTDSEEFYQLFINSVPPADLEREISLTEIREVLGIQDTLWCLRNVLKERKLIESIIKEIRKDIFRCIGELDYGICEEGFAELVKRYSDKTVAFKDQLPAPLEQMVDAASANTLYYALCAFCSGLSGRRYHKESKAFYKKYMDKFEEAIRE